jgi:hypothetical protein
MYTLLYVVTPLYVYTYLAICRYYCIYVLIPLHICLHLALGVMCAYMFVVTIKYVTLKYDVSHMVRMVLTCAVINRE